MNIIFNNIFIIRLIIFYNVGNQTNSEFCRSSLWLYYMFCNNNLNNKNLSKSHEKIFIYVIFVKLFYDK